MKELSQGLIQNASNSTQDHSKPLECQPHDIIRQYIPNLNEVISTPDRLADQLWSAGFISDHVKDDFLTTEGQSRYKKASTLTHELYKYFKGSDEDKVCRFRELCEILKDHCWPAPLPTQMMGEVQNFIIDLAACICKHAISKNLYTTTCIICKLYANCRFIMEKCS